MTPYHFQFSYINHSKQLEEIGDWVKGKIIKDPLLRICAGIYADSHLFNDPVKSENISEILTTIQKYNEMDAVLHFSFKESQIPLKEIVTLKKLFPRLTYLQLNDVSNNHIEILNYACQYFSVLVPLDNEHFELVEKRLFISLIKKYKARVCLDNSKGGGKQESFERYKNKIDTLVSIGLKDIGVSGGFGPGKLGTYLKLRDYYALPLSLDAETNLKSNGEIDLLKVKAYLTELLNFPKIINS